jgi:hypothetical protein
VSNEGHPGFLAAVLLLALGWFPARADDAEEPPQPVLAPASSLR